MLIKLFVYVTVITSPPYIIPMTGGPIVTWARAPSPDNPPYTPIHPPCPVSPLHIGVIWGPKGGIILLRKRIS